MSGATPVHSVRLTMKPGGDGVAKVTKLTVGTRIVNKVRRIEFTKSRKASPEQVSLFRLRVDEVRLWEVEPFDPYGNDPNTICLHPTILLFEAIKDGEYKLHQESLCQFSEISRTLVPAFYDIAGIGPEAGDWSLIEYFENSK